MICGVAGAADPICLPPYTPVLWGGRQVPVCRNHLAFVRPLVEDEIPKVRAAWTPPATLLPAKPAPPPPKHRKDASWVWCAIESCTRRTEHESGICYNHRRQPPLVNAHCIRCGNRITRMSKSGFCTVCADWYHVVKVYYVVTPADFVRVTAGRTRDGQNGLWKEFPKRARRAS